MKKLIFFLLLSLGLKSAQSGLITFEFDTAGPAGAALDGVSTGSVISSILSMNATAHSSSGVPLFNQTGSGGFGINIDADSGDDSDAFDGGVGIEAMEFTITSSEPISSLSLVSIEFDRFTTGDAVSVFVGGINLDAAGDGQFVDSELNGADVLLLNHGLTTETVRIEYVAGGGFGLENIVFDAVTVPEPGCVGLLVVGATAFCLRCRRRQVSRHNEARRQ